MEIIKRGLLSIITPWKREVNLVIYWYFFCLNTIRQVHNFCCCCCWYVVIAVVFSIVYAIQWLNLVCFGNYKWYAISSCHNVKFRRDIALAKTLQGRVFLGLYFNHRVVFVWIQNNYVLNLIYVYPRAKLQHVIMFVRNGSLIIYIILIIFYKLMQILLFVVFSYAT